MAKLYHCLPQHNEWKHVKSLPPHLLAVVRVNSNVPFDRFGYAQPPVDFVLSERAVYKFPGRDLKPWATLMQERAGEILSWDKPLMVYWSGGIDSTAVMVALMKAGADASNVTVMCNRRSQLEHGNFYKRFIQGKFPEEKSADASIVLSRNKDVVLVTGELNDQMYGSDAMQKTVLRGGYHLLDKPATEDNFTVASVAMGYTQEEAEPLFRDIMGSANTQGIVPRSVLECYWWLNFGFKFQSVVYRMMILGPHELNTQMTMADFDRLNHFFNTDGFQTWACTRHEKKYLNRWADYKATCKNYIFEFDGDEDYLLHSIKQMSLRQFTGAGFSTAIGEDLQCFKTPIVEGRPWATHLTTLQSGNA